MSSTPTKGNNGAKRFNAGDFGTKYAPIINLVRILYTDWEAANVSAPTYIREFLTDIKLSPKFNFANINRGYRGFLNT